MMRIEITKNKLPGLSAAVKKSLEFVISEVSAQVEGAAKEKAIVDTGYMRSSITHETDGLQGTVSVGADYAVYVEFGTERQSPQPFLRPALTEAKDDFERRIAIAVKEATR